MEPTRPIQLRRSQEPRGRIRAIRRRSPSSCTAAPRRAGTPIQTLTATRGSGGAYSVDASSPLVGGTYTARAEQRDADDNLGLSQARTFSVHSGYRDEILADQPIAYWRLGESSGTTAFDQAGPTNGSYQNGVTLGQSGALITGSDSAAAFDGVDDQVTVPHSASLNATNDGYGRSVDQAVEVRRLAERRCQVGWRRGR